MGVEATNGHQTPSALRLRSTRGQLTKVGKTVRPSQPIKSRMSAGETWAEPACAMAKRDAGNLGLAIAADGACGLRAPSFDTLHVQMMKRRHARCISDKSHTKCRARGMAALSGLLESSGLSGLSELNGVSGRLGNSFTSIACGIRLHEVL
eukprot:gnl/TRDRNA2_/TRDRNA2_166370_c0_seq1.p1 gnl/TRDRNA2_/TRDRNA2_166370_c0~~gnl/TRDRNA2_/TRDRNA2_166370_c0_seq1.p1  ORF type:complete len:151 (+),score=10.75 gnl/TRDRNA2_/TRDRNA2_166370_c0_seq1:166-618(+)